MSFALAEDARRAAKELDGSQLGNRAIQVLPLCSLARCLALLVCSSDTLVQPLWKVT